MTPEFSSTSMDDMGTEAAMAAFRRGKVQVLTLAVGTAVFFFAQNVYDYWIGKEPATLSDLIFGLVIIGLICRSVYRGGQLASGCIIVLCIPLCIGLVFSALIIMVNPLAPLHLSFGVGRDFPDIGRDWKSTALFLPAGLWSAYALWVLIVSKEARLYMQTRRRGIERAEALAFEWPPPRRR